jgi:hypothetical protein
MLTVANQREVSTMQSTSIAADPDAALNENQAAEFLGVSVRTLQAWRVRGGGLAYVKIGRAVRYQRRVLVAFQQSHTVTSTTEADGVTEATFQADGVAVAIWRLVTTDRKGGFEGTASELLEAINAQASDAAKGGKYWPQNAAQLGHRVLRAAPLLRAKGCMVDRGHSDSGVRTITIFPQKIIAQEIGR